MTEQPNKSVSDLESDIAKSRERLAATIDELAFRAQPKNIVADQKRQLRETVMAETPWRRAAWPSRAGRGSPRECSAPRC